MEEINYINALLWYSSWPIVIFICYKFIILNIEHLEENLEIKDKK